MSVMNATAPGVPTPLGGSGMSREARRQQALVHALWVSNPPREADEELGLRQTGARWRSGLAAYRGNGLANGSAALRVQFPTLLAMLGESAFDAVAARYWRGWPPRHGDLARLGEDFATCLQAQPDLDAWPWLADCARLDWALWRALDAPVPAFGASDLQRLASDDPATLRLHLAQGACLLRASWPVVSLWRLHQHPTPDGDVLRQIVRTGPETAWVWRDGFKPRVRAVSDAEAAWLTALQRPTRLDLALDAAADGFDVGAWLHDAIAQGWLDRVERLA